MGAKSKIRQSVGEVVIYKSSQGETELAVKLKDETVWLTPVQMSKLFGKARPTILEHIKNVYSEAELESSSTCRKFRQVQFEGKRKIIRNIDHYNLDVIISVGYRVKSKRGTQFRIWANKVLKEYLVKGYALNEHMLKEQNEKVKELEKSLEVFKRIAKSHQLKQDEFSGILKVISDYTYALDVLDQYDHQLLKIDKVEINEEFKISYKNSANIIAGLKKKFGSPDLFGKEKDNSFRSTLGTLYQTFNKKELYPSIEEKAAMLLYLTIKNHSFIDGNKRIAAALFIMYLDKNRYLYRKNGEKRLADNALVALCLMIAESHPKEMDTMVKVVINLINRNN